jgi:hypothetical protein
MLYVEGEVLRMTDCALRPTFPRGGGGRPFPLSIVR